MILFTDIQPYVEDAVLINKQASEADLAIVKLSFKPYKYPFETDKSAIQAQLIGNDDSLEAS